MSQDKPEGFNKKESQWWYSKSTDPYHGEVYRRVIELTNPGKGARWLDLCCGPGIFLNKVLESGADATGLDSSEIMLGMARENAPGAALIYGKAYDPPTGIDYTHVSFLFPAIDAGKRDNKEVIGNQIDVVQEVLTLSGLGNPLRIFEYLQIFLAERTNRTDYDAARIALKHVLRGTDYKPKDVFISARQIAGTRQIFSRAYDILQPGGQFIFAEYLNCHGSPDRENLEAMCQMFLGKPSEDTPYTFRALEHLVIPELHADIIELGEIRKERGQRHANPYAGAILAVLEKPQKNKRRRPKRH